MPKLSATKRKIRQLIFRGWIWSKSWPLTLSYYSMLLPNRPAKNRRGIHSVASKSKGIRGSYYLNLGYDPCTDEGYNRWTTLQFIGKIERNTTHFQSSMMNRSGMHKAFVRLQLLLKIRIIIQCPNVTNQTIFTKGKQCAAAPLSCDACDHRHVHGRDDIY